jgi:hypothetical protein
MNEDMPWVNLTQEEVEELRNKKHELTEYGKQRLKELMGNQVNSEAEKKALAALDELYEKHGDAMLKLAEIEKEEWERRERADTVLARYNRFYNDECSGMPHGTPITPEHMQAMALECMIDTLRCENMNMEYNVIAIDDIKDLIEGLNQQGRDYLKRVQEFKDSADGVA